MSGDEKKERYKEEVEQHLEIQKTIMKCISTLNISENVDRASNELLAAVAEFYRADRCSVFEIDEDFNRIHNTYEWCAEGIESGMQQYANIDINVSVKLIKAFKKRDFIYINTKKNPPENAREQEFVINMKFESVMAAALRDEKGLIGYVVVDNPKDNIDTEIVLTSAAAFVVNDIHKRKNLEQNIIKSIAKIYSSMFIVDVKDDVLFELKNTGEGQRLDTYRENASNYIRNLVIEVSDSEYLESTLEFSDLSTLNERMRDTDVISHEFYEKKDYWCRLNFIAVSRDNDNNLIYIINAAQNIDKEKRRELEYQHALQTALENQNEIYAEMLHIQGCGVIASRAENGQIIMVNDAAMELLGMTKSSNFYEEMFNSIIADNKDEIRENFKRVMRDFGRYSYEYAIKRPDGRTVYIMSEVRAAILAGGDKVMINSLMDITDKKKLEEELVLLSGTDALTGIDNRRSGEAKIEKMLSEGRKGMYCLFDIDKFKSINDSFGHAVGDKALIETANCLKRCFRSTDITMRLGGDEFAVFLVGVSSEEMGASNIKRLFRELDKVSIPEMNGRKIFVSLGAVLCGDEETDYEKLYAKADKTMYICKNKPGSYFEFYH